MPHDPMVLDSLASALQAAGVGVLASTLFKDGLPTDPPLSDPQALVTGLVEVPGMAPVHVHDQQQASYEQPMVQVLVRGAPYGSEAARLKAQDAFDALDGLANVDLSGVRYLWVQAMESPFKLRTDEQHRPIFLFRVRVAKAVS